MGKTGLRYGSEWQLLRFLLAGLMAGVAMIPFGIFYKYGLSLPVNVYGELIVVAVFGELSRWALVAEHFLISGVLAVPFFVAARRFPRRTLVATGLLYGATIWVVINSLALPLIFSRSTPWELGWSSIWPSLSVHLVYGIALGVLSRSRR
jgi:Protein of unknown function (DUF1440)